MPRLAIVGAGIAGCAAAYALRESDLEVVLFEKSRGPSGRAATRGRDGFRYDHGANYFKIDDPVVEKIIRGELPTDDLVDIARPVWTFDGAGDVTPGDPAQNAAPKWTYRSGISALGKLLLASAGARLMPETRIRALTSKGKTWELHADDGTLLGLFDAVLLTPPAPQTAELLAASAFDPRLRAALVETLRSVSYRTQWSFALAFDRRLERTAPFYGLVNADGRHDVAWLSFEDDKPGHVPDGRSLMVVQMAPAWSRTHFDASEEVQAAKVLRQVRLLIGGSVPEPMWVDRQRWRYALPEGEADHACSEAAAQHGLFFAGDAWAGKGRVVLALASGLAAARALRLAWSG